MGAKRITFHTLDVGQDAVGNLVAFPAHHFATEVQNLTGDDRYFVHKDNLGTRCIVAHPAGPTRVLFCSVRWDERPMIDDMDQDELHNIPLTHRQGVADPAYIVFLPEASDGRVRNIFGVVNNHYGPSFSRIKEYLWRKLEDFGFIQQYQLGEPFIFDRMRRGILEKFRSYQDLTEITVRVRPDEFLRDSEDVDADLVKGIQELQHMSSARTLALTFGAYAGQGNPRKEDHLDNGFRKKVEGLLGTKSGRGGLHGLTAKARIPGTRSLDKLNLLEPAFHVFKKIERSAEDSRSLDRESAFEVIVKAYNDNRDDILASTCLDRSSVFRAEYVTSHGPVD